MIPLSSPEINVFVSKFLDEDIKTNFFPSPWILVNRSVSLYTVRDPIRDLYVDTCFVYRHESLPPLFVYLCLYVKLLRSLFFLQKPNPPVYGDPYVVSSLKDFLCTLVTGSSSSSHKVCLLYSYKSHTLDSCRLLETCQTLEWDETSIEQSDGT